MLLFTTIDISLIQNTVEASADNNTVVVEQTNNSGSYTTTQSGIYLIQLWGASGGGADSIKGKGGYGGYIEGKIKLSSGTTLSWVAGTQGSLNGSSSYGSGGSASNGGYSGGGYSSVSLSGSTVLLAGGGGGLSSHQLTRNESTCGGQYAGYGGGLGASALGSKSGMHSFHWNTVSQAYEQYGIQRSQNAAKVNNNAPDSGGSATNGCGGGGGGWYAGTSGSSWDSTINDDLPEDRQEAIDEGKTWKFDSSNLEKNYSGGGGGTSYYNDSKMYDVEEHAGQNLGQGKVKITFLQTYTVPITIILKGNGTISGICATLEHTYTFEKNCDETFPLPVVTTRDTANISFTGYTKLSGDGSLSGSGGTSSYSVNAGLKGIVIEANYSSTGISFSQTVSGSSVKLEWEDTSATFYRVYKAVDQSGTSITDNFTLDNESNTYTVTGADTTDVLTYNSSSNTYTVPVSGYYEVKVSGEQGESNRDSSTTSGSHTIISSSVKGLRATATMYFNAGDTLYTQLYSGGQGKTSSVRSSAIGGDGGAGTGLYLGSNTTPVIAAGGGAGAHTCYKASNGVHFNSGAGLSYTHDKSESTTGSNGIEITGHGTADDGTDLTEWVGASGGGGGGYPKGGGVSNESGVENASSGMSYIAGTEFTNSSDSPSISGTINGKSVTGAKVEKNAAQSRTATIELKSIAGGMTDKTKTYDLVDKQAPYKPTASSKAYSLSSETSSEYTISWQAPQDRGSQNMFYVESYNAKAETLHKSAIYTVTYTSGVKNYEISKDNQATWEEVNSTSYSGCQAGGTYYVRAVDYSGNKGEALEIKIPNVMTVVYSLNNTTNNINNMPYSYDATGSIPSEIVYPDESTTIASNGGRMVRTGYLATYRSTDGATEWHDKDGNVYHAGDVINYRSGTLILYAQWTPIQYTVTLNQNRPSDTTRAVGIVGDHGVSNLKSNSQDGWTLNSSTGQYYKNFVYDSTTLQGPSSFYSLTGWHLDTDTKWYESGGTNGEVGSTSHEKFDTARFNNLTSTNNTKFSFYPKWVKNNYTIKYDMNTGTISIFGDTYSTTPSGTVGDTSCTYDTDVTLATNSFTRIGYTFVGWSTNPNWGQGQTDIDAWLALKDSKVGHFNSNTTVVNTSATSSDIYAGGQTLYKPNFTAVNNGTITLYAIWEPVIYTIEFKGNHYTSGSVNSMRVRYDQTVTLNQNQFLRQYTVTFKNAEPWLANDSNYGQSVNGTKNEASGTVNYTFAGWSQATALGNSPYYEVSGTNTISSGTGTSDNNYKVTTSTTLLADQASVKNLTITGGDVVKLYASWNSNTIDVPSTVTGQNEYHFIGWSTRSYTDSRVYNGTINNNKDDVGYTITSGGKYKPYVSITLYAHWKKTVTLTFNLNGGTFREGGTPKVTGVYYDYAPGYTFGIYNNHTSQVKGKYDTQSRNIDAYGTYDSNGINDTYTKISDNTSYRLLGWTFIKDNSTLEQAVPETRSDGKIFSVYANNASKVTQVNIYNSTTLYTVWEPVLSIDFSLNRSLGNISSVSESKKESVTAVSSLVDRTVSMKIKSGEQANYTILTSRPLTWLTSSKIKVNVEFDRDASGNGYSTISGLSVQGIYDVKNADNSTPQWCDNLNPNTSEDKRANQSSGLDRTFMINNITEMRTFYIPYYLGTSQSYNSKNAGVSEYHASVTLSKPSYYWSTVRNSDEIIVMDCKLQLQGESDGDGEINPDSYSVLPELKTQVTGN
jgi:hypothetical protein